MQPVSLLRRPADGRPRRRQNRIEPPAPIDKDLCDLPAEEKRSIRNTRLLPEALDALEADQEFLLKGDVFTKDTIRAWVEFKRTRECDQVALRPHPHEFALYYDI